MQLVVCLSTVYQLPTNLIIHIKNIQTEVLRQIELQVIEFTEHFLCQTL